MTLFFASALVLILAGPFTLLGVGVYRMERGR